MGDIDKKKLFGELQKLASRWENVTEEGLLMIACAVLRQRITELETKLTASQRKVDDLYNLFAYAEQDEDVLEMTGGKPLIGWLREREEEWYRKGNR